MHKYNYQITVYVSVCLKACYMFHYHYQHFEVENHLQYNKLCGAMKANTKQPGFTRARGGEEVGGGGAVVGGDVGGTNDQAHGRC